MRIGLFFANSQTTKKAFKFAVMKLLFKRHLINPQKSKNRNF